MIAMQRLLDVFVEVADTLVDDYDTIDFLHQLTENVAEVCAAESVGLMLGDEFDELHAMAASSEQARRVEALQLEVGEGPCLDCFHTGAAVIVPDLSAAEDRWPRFASSAKAEGVRAVHAFPMRLREQVIGAMNVFSQVPLPLDDTEARTVQALADVATIAIIQQRSLFAAEALAEQLQGALQSRIVIEQAKGVVARSLSVDVNEGFALMRRHARAHTLRLGDVAAALVGRELDPEALRPGSQS